MAFQCFDDPAAILEKAFCVTQTSKDLKGELKLGSSKGQKPREKQDCDHLPHRHLLEARLDYHPAIVSPPLTLRTCPVT